MIERRRQYGDGTRYERNENDWNGVLEVVLTEWESEEERGRALVEGY